MSSAAEPALGKNCLIWSAKRGRLRKNKIFFPRSKTARENLISMIWWNFKALIITGTLYKKKKKNHVYDPWAYYLFLIGSFSGPGSNV